MANGYLQVIEKRDTAVTFFLLGLVCGMIVAFASCSAVTPDQYNQRQTERVLPAVR